MLKSSSDVVLRHAALDAFTGPGLGNTLYRSRLGHRVAEAIRMKDASHAAAPAARVRRWRSRRGNAESPLPKARLRDWVLG